MWEREQEKERMSNELRWVRHLHSLPVFFRREGEEKRRVRKGGLEENKSEMKAFLEATKELYTGKGLGNAQWG